jgi:cytochrome c oxidase subunit I
MNTPSVSADSAFLEQDRTARYALAVPRGARRALAAGWLGLALASLVGAGLFSVLLVLARAPYVKDVFPFAGFFRVALIVHVDLSVLVWFAACAGILWTLNGSRHFMALGWAALATCAAGALLMSASPFLEEALPVMSNYIPVLDGPLFLRGLLIFAAGAALLVLRALLCAPSVGTRPDGAAALRFGLNAAAISAAVALIAFAWSWSALPDTLEGKAYYEVLFWGGGHVLQFTWTLLMFVAWLWLADAIGARAALSPRVAILLFTIALVSVFATPVLYLAYDVVSVEHYRMQTWLMRIGGGLAIVPFAFATIWALVSSRKSSKEETSRNPIDNRQPLRAALAWSLVLFGAGGLIGLAIHGNNVKIPAHYHGSIVGVTLALMGLAYHLLPRLGFAAPGRRLATLQPTLYGAGQLLHVIGLVWSGGYGVQRKVAGSEQVLRGAEQVAAMGLMGLGGLLAVLGGLLFIVVVGRSMMARPKANPAWTSSTSPR